MFLNKLEFKKRSYTLKKTIFLKGYPLKIREVLEITLFQGSEAIKVEAAPLPYYSLETLEELITILNALKKKLPMSLKDILEQVEVNKYPSLQMALGLGMLAFESRSALGEKATISTNALIDRIGNDLESRVLEKVKNGFSCIKVKVAREERNIEKKGLLELKGILETENLRLRLDSNRQWTLEEWRGFYGDIKEIVPYIEYFEEPVYGNIPMEDIEEMAERMGVKYAIDERVLDMSDLMESLKYSHLKAIIIKPTLYGSIGKIADFSKKIKNRKKVIISSSFESPLGLEGLIALAYMVAPKEDHGLDTFEYFK